MRRREAGIRTAPGRPTVGLLVLLLALSACGNTPQRAFDVEEAFADPHPSQRTRAVADVGRRGDPTYVPQLIELLDDPDPGVRMAAGATLKDLTGRDTGYEPWADPAARRAQLASWRHWWATRQAAAPR